MSRWMVLLMGFFAAAVQAAPMHLVAVYHATRNGQPFAHITETFHQEGGRYRLESVTEGIGVYGLFGKRRLVSAGEVTADGLRPLHFEQQQGDDARRDIKAEFDWVGGRLVITYKGKEKIETLLPGTQDIAGYAYQFMFAPPRGDEVSLPVTTGKKLRSYRYTVTARDVFVDTPAGKYRTVQLSNAGEGEDSKQLWLGAEAHHIPVRILMQDEKGARIEQVLTSLHVE